MGPGTRVLQGVGNRPDFALVNSLIHHIRFRQFILGAKVALLPPLQHLRSDNNGFSTLNLGPSSRPTTGHVQLKGHFRHKRGIVATIPRRKRQPVLQTRQLAVADGNMGPSGCLYGLPQQRIKSHEGPATHSPKRITQTIAQ